MSYFKKKNKFGNAQTYLNLNHEVSSSRHRKIESKAKQTTQKLAPVKDRMANAIRIMLNDAILATGDQEMSEVK